jgi:hypothetical protein
MSDKFHTWNPGKVSILICALLLPLYAKAEKQKKAAAARWRKAAVEEGPAGLGWPRLALASTLAG